MRMTRKRRRQMRRRQRWQQRGWQLGRVLTALGVGLLPGAQTEAAAVHTPSEVMSGFDQLYYAREEVVNYRAAQQNVRDAQANLQQARQDLAEAQQNKKDAEVNLQAAQQEVQQARYALQAVMKELQAAQAESAQRTEAALAAQQAVAAFQPQVWDQETVVQEAQAEADAVAAADPVVSYGGGAGAAGTVRSQAASSDLAAAIERAWRSVDYQQNRLTDVEVMIAGRGDGSGDAADGSAGDDTAAQAALAQAEAEARERVRDLQRDETEARNYVQTATQEQTAARQWAAEAATAETQAVAQEQLAIDWDTQARYDLAHFGEGRGWETGFEFDNWHASWQPRVVGETTPRQDGLRGHQLYLPLAAYAAEKHWDFSLSGGWLESRSGRVHGHVSGWTDTALAAVYKNDHPQYDVHYGLGLNVPTGRDNVHQNAMLPEDLARFTSFGTGWNYTPSVTVTRHLTDEDKWTAGVSYTWNGTYDFQLDGMKLSIMQEQDPNDGQWYAPYVELAET